MTEKAKIQMLWQKMKINSKTDEREDVGGEMRCCGVAHRLGNNHGTLVTPAEVLVVLSTLEPCVQDTNQSGDSFQTLTSWRWRHATQEEFHLFRNVCILQFPCLYVQRWTAPNRVKSIYVHGYQPMTSAHSSVEVKFA